MYCTLGDLRSASGVVAWRLAGATRVFQFEPTQTDAVREHERGTRVKYAHRTLFTKLKNDSRTRWLRYGLGAEARVRPVLPGERARARKFKISRYMYY